MYLRPSPHVRPRVYPRALCCLLVREPDGCVGGCGFSVDGGAVVAFNGESVVCGASAVDAGVEGDGCGVSLDGGVEGVGAGFASASPRVVGVVGAVVVVVACNVGAFCHWLRLVCVGGLFACVLRAGAGDPCVGDGADCVAVWQGDGGGVAASLVGAWLVVQGCVCGDGASVFAHHVVARAHGLVGVLVLPHDHVLGRVTVTLSWRESEYAVRSASDGFADQHVGERLLLAPHPFVDLGSCECYADGGEGLALVARCGEGAGGDVGVPGADGGGHGFALVEEDECEARDGARVAHVGVEVRSFDDSPVGFCARGRERVLVVVVCACCVGGYTSGVAAECDGEVGAVVECDDVAVVVSDVAAVEELVEVGGEMALVADGVLCGARWCEAASDVVPRVHGSLLFLSAVFCLFLCALVACCLPRAWRKPGCSMRSRGCFLFRARFSARYGTMVLLLLAKRDCGRLLWTVPCLVRA